MKLNMTKFESLNDLPHFEDLIIFIDKGDAEFDNDFYTAGSHYAGDENNTLEFVGFNISNNGGAFEIPIEDFEKYSGYYAKVSDNLT